MLIFAVLNSSDCPRAHRGAVVLLNTENRETHYFYPSSSGAVSGARNPEKFAREYPGEQFTIPPHILRDSFIGCAGLLPYARELSALHCGAVVKREEIPALLSADELGELSRACIGETETAWFRELSRELETR